MLLVSGLVQDSNSDLLDYFESVKRKANHSGKMSAMNEVIESLKIYDDESGLSPKKKAKGEGRMTIQTILSDEVNLLPLAPFRKFLVRLSIHVYIYNLHIYICRCYPLFAFPLVISCRNRFMPFLTKPNRISFLQRSVHSLHQMKSYNRSKKFFLQKRTH